METSPTNDSYDADADDDADAAAARKSISESTTRSLGPLEFGSSDAR